MASTVAGWQMINYKNQKSEEWSNAIKAAAEPVSLTITPLGLALSHTVITCTSSQL